jgi:fucose permease
VAVGIGIEFCIVYFGAELLSAATRLSTATAATAMAVFYAGILAGRISAGLLTRRPGHSVGLVWVSLAVTTAGFAAFWLSAHAVVALPGLFLTGVGVANLFPLSLALTLEAAPGRTDSANARTQLLGGLVVIAAPFLLGALADHIGLSAAFGVVPVLVAVCALLLLAARASRPGHPPNPP